MLTSLRVRAYVCRYNSFRSAFEILETMKKDGRMKPDEIMYNSLLDGCAQANLVDEAMKLLEEWMTNTSLGSDGKSFAMLYDMLTNALSVKLMIDDSPQVFGAFLARLVAPRIPEELLLILGAAAWLDAPWSRIYETIDQIGDDMRLWEPSVRRNRIRRPLCFPRRRSTPPGLVHRSEYEGSGWKKTND